MLQIGLQIMQHTNRRRLRHDGSRQWKLRKIQILCQTQSTCFLPISQFLFYILFFLFSMLFCSCARMHCVSLIRPKERRRGGSPSKRFECVADVDEFEWKAAVHGRTGQGKGRPEKDIQDEGQTTSQVRQSKAKPKSLHAWIREPAKQGRTVKGWCGIQDDTRRKIETTGLAKWLRSWTLPTDLCNFCHHFIYLIDEYGVNGTIFFLSVESGCWC